MGQLETIPGGKLETCTEFSSSTKAQTSSQNPHGLWGFGRVMKRDKAEPLDTKLLSPLCCQKQNASSPRQQEHSTAERSQVSVPSAAGQGPSGVKL